MEVFKKACKSSRASFSCARHTPTPHSPCELTRHHSKHNRFLSGPPLRFHPIRVTATVPGQAHVMLERMQAPHAYAGRHMHHNVPSPGGHPRILKHVSSACPLP